MSTTSARRNLSRSFQIVICSQLLTVAVVAYVILSPRLTKRSCFDLQCGNRDDWVKPILRFQFNEWVHWPLRHICSRQGYDIEVNPSVFIDNGWTPAEQYFRTQVFFTIDHPESTDKIKDEIPGLDDFVTYKAFLVKRGGKYIPKGFHLPEQKEEFLSYIEAPPNTKKRWVQKDARHRGIMVKEIHEIDVDAESLIQEYVSNPFLIDGRRFSVGIYVAFSSANPLRAYILDSTLHLRVCEKEYYPENLTDFATYVPDGQEIVNLRLIRQVEHLKEYYVKNKYSIKRALDTYLISKGRDPSLMYAQIYDAVRDVLNRDIRLLGRNANPKTKYFEYTRWDFILDNDFNVHLMEANFNPHLAYENPSRLDIHHKEHVTYNLFRVMGLEDLTNFQYNRASYIVRDNDVQINDQVCYLSSCASCDRKECSSCHHCLSQRQVEILKGVLWEHLKRGTNRLVYPYVTDNGLAHDRQDEGGEMDGNTLTVDWLHAKCKKDIHWCSIY